MKLFWDDVKNNKYLLGELYKKDDLYHFEINENGLKSAIRNGCFGIGQINIFEKEHISSELFSFFKNRIPSKDNPSIEQILDSLGLETYDEYELLRKTHGRLITDRYYLED